MGNWNARQIGISLDLGLSTLPGGDKCLSLEKHSQGKDGHQCAKSYNFPLHQLPWWFPSRQRVEMDTKSVLFFCQWLCTHQRPREPFIQTHIQASGYSSPQRICWSKNHVIGQEGIGFPLWSMAWVKARHQSSAKLVWPFCVMTMLDLNMK